MLEPELDLADEEDAVGPDVAVVDKKYVTELVVVAADVAAEVRIECVAQQEQQELEQTSFAAAVVAEEVVDPQEQQRRQLGASEVEAVEMFA